jgi:hypothetical protein
LGNPCRRTRQWRTACRLVSCPRNFAGVRLAELGSIAGDVAYSAVSMAITRFEKRLKIDAICNDESKPYGQFWSFDGLAGQAFYCTATLKVKFRRDPDRWTSLDLQLQPHSSSSALAIQRSSHIRGGSYDWSQQKTAASCCTSSRYRQNELASSICRGDLHSTWNRAGLATITATHLARDMATFRRLRLYKNSIPRGASSLLEVVME